MVSLVCQALGDRNQLPNSCLILVVSVHIVVILTLDPKFTGTQTGELIKSDDD